MPFLGSSSIFGGGKGPTGETGPVGNIGNTGNSGVVKGNTGTTGAYIIRVDSDRQNNKITFYTSDEKIFTLENFSGPSGTVYGADGVSAAYSALYYSLFSGVTGTTFTFLGVCGGSNVSVSFSPDQSKILVNINSTSGGHSKISNPDYVVFSDNPYLRATKIYADSNNVLNFGLTGIPSGITESTVFSHIKEEMVFIEPEVPNQSGGIELDLRSASNYWIETPIGITLFRGISLSGIRQEYTLFFNGGAVWNLPKNVYFENTEYGIKNHGFLSGINIVHIWSENGGETFNASFIERGLGASGPYEMYNIGSCCYKRFGYRYCDDGVTEQYCSNIGGIFQSFIKCSSRLNIDDCGPRLNHNIAGETGACCCGMTGCLDNSPGSIDPSIVTINRDICENVIGGKFYPKKQCGPGDLWSQYNRRTGDGNTAPNIFCHKGCIDPVSCYRVVNGTGICTQETLAYCNEIGGSGIVNKTCDEITQIGGAAELTREGYCYKFGRCSEFPNIKKYECIPCGTWNGITCDKSAVVPVSKTIITTPNPLIKIVHSVATVDDRNVVTTYSDRDPTANALTFQIVQETTQKHTLYGIVKLLDVAITGQTVFNIWDLQPQDNECLQISVFDEDGLTLTENSFIEKDRRYYLQINGVPSRCIDTDFKAEIYLGLNSCVGGFTLGSKSDTVPIIYTRSPCSCISVDPNTGDVINKAPITIPYSAERFCLDCTKQYPGNKITTTATSVPHIAHIPYPLKRQSGVITFCPPTENFQDNPISICTNPEGFCVSYGRIEELSGCTYSSRFDANNDGKIFNDTNTAPSDCYHAEYNIPGAGTTYFYTGISNQNIRSCENRCKLRTHYNNTAEELQTNMECSSIDCSVYSSDACCSKTYPSSTQLANINACKTCAGNNNSITGPCPYIYANPYYNKLYLDSNALYDIGEKYNIDITVLEQNIKSIIEKKNLLFDPVFIGVGADGGLYGITSSDSGVGGATIERYISGQTLNPDPDDRAKNSCLTCSGFFNKSNKIRIPKTGYSDGLYDVYGVLVEKENICKVLEKTSRPRNYTENQTDKKYYIFIKKTDNSCYLIYDIGTQTRIGSNILTVDKFFDSNTNCSLDCGDFTSTFKEIKWFGTINSGSLFTPASGDLCEDSFILNYNIKKDLNEKSYTFETIKNYNLDDIINFNNLSYSESQKIIKNKELAKTIFNIIGKTIPEHTAKFCSLCSGDNCYSDIVNNFIEYIGNSCTVDGISGAATDAEFYEDVFTFKPDQIKIPFNPLIKYKDISAGFHYTIGITAGGPGSTGGFVGWGRNNIGFIDKFAIDGITFIQISAGANCACAIQGFTASGVYKTKLVCKGFSEDAGKVYPAQSQIGVRDVSVGYGHTTWIDSNGGISCTPSLDNSPFRDGVRGWYYFKNQNPMPQAKSVSSGKFHSCAVLSNNGITCWGDNFFGQCNVPVGLTASIISCGGHHTLALKGDGTLVSWGGVTAFGLKTVPSGAFKAISAGYIHNCGIKSDGGITCWGYTYDGQCQAPTTGVYTKISAGREHTVAIDETGGITCWGTIGEDGVCASFEDTTLIGHSNSKLNWFLEGKRKEQSPKDLFNTVPGGITSYFATETNYPGLSRFGEFTPKFFSNNFIGGIYNKDNQIKKQKKLINLPSNKISFYYAYKPSSKDIIDNEFMHYDMIYYSSNDTRRFRFEEEQAIIIKKTIPKLDILTWRDTISVSDITSYISITFEDNQYYYEPAITFNVKQTISVGPQLFASVYTIDDSGNIELVNKDYNADTTDNFISYTTQGTDEFDTNKYIIRGTKVTDNKHPSLNFKNKYLLIYSQNNISSGEVYYNYINYYPGLTFGVDQFKTFFSNNMGSNYLSSFDIKGIPEPDTGQESLKQLNFKDTTNTKNKNINGICLQIDCSQIPEFCSDYGSC